MSEPSKTKLRILYISQYFPPEIGATQTRAIEMARNLVTYGHDVTVLTEFPNHPSGILPEKYRFKFLETDTIDGIRVRRSWVYATPNKTFVTRLAFYFSFMFSAIFSGLLTRGRYDVVYTTSPPFFVGVSGYVLSRLKRARFVFEIRDLWPDSAVELGELNNPRFIRWAQKLEQFFYRNASKLVVVTKGTYNHLLAQGIPASRLELIPNGTNTAIFANRGDALKKTLQLQDKFVVGYSGILGLAQGMEQLCELVEEMRVHPDVHFLFVGTGPKKHVVEAIKAEKRLGNLTLIDEVPREQIADYISAWDVSLVPLRKNELFKITIPSKIYDNMACERPIILSVDGEARSILEQAQAGIYVEPENSGQMMAAILQLKADPAVCREMGKNGRAFVDAYYSRERLAHKLEQSLMELC
ncbi:glycosyltransferase family 4 protein [candidate division KSB1 bacterium]|nr:glycosyltransferase family 4 protein [candidate division KSB1 bacterium]